MNIKNIAILIAALLLIGLGGFFLTQMSATETAENNKQTIEVPVIPPNNASTSTSTKPEVSIERGEQTTIGKSVEGNDITAYHFGTGQEELLFIGGIHGGYSWNTTLLAYEMIDYLKENPDVIPNNVTVTIIPVANPDGLSATVGTDGRFEASSALSLSESVRIAGRFNANNVDLNRNFDCEWKKTSMWRSQTVSGGEAAFSEPEAAVIADYVLKNKPAAAVVWFSAEGKVYPSACGENPSQQSLTLANVFGQGSGYEVSEEFNAYQINGDMVNWMAKEEIPAISVLLSDHKNTEWAKNKAGLEAILETYRN